MRREGCQHVRRWWTRVVAFCVALGLWLGPGAGAGRAAAWAASAAEGSVVQTPGAVADHYSQPGPWGAAITGSADAPAAEGVRFWYPETLGAFGADHPVLTWGNGTDARTDSYTDLIEHLASWGFVVVASNSGRTGGGDEMLAAAEWMVDQNDNPASVFYGDLNTNAVGALGHSQGAGGAIYATVESDGLITSTLPIALPDVGWWNPPFTLDDAAGLVGRLEDPIFYMYGNDDLITLWDQEHWFDATGGPALMASLVGGHHNLPVNDELCGWGYCGQAPQIEGYTTAWFVYTLAHDQFARQAFVGDGGGPGEIMADARWMRKDAEGLS
jgi:hypothetical protein